MMRHSGEELDREPARDRRSELGRQYRAIGIGAVAAALTVGGRESDKRKAPDMPTEEKAEPERTVLAA